MTDDATLQSMYPSMFKTETKLADPPANIAALREEQKDLTTAYPTMRDSLVDRAGFVDSLEAPPEQMRAQRAEVAALWQDVGASSEDVAHAMGLARKFATNPPSAAEQTSMRADAEKQLRDVYGDGARQALLDARALVQRDPRFAALVNKTGIGDSATFVLRMAALARSERSRGRLK